jgi:hypothetical protein
MNKMRKMILIQLYGQAWRPPLLAYWLDESRLEKQPEITGPRVWKIGKDSVNFFSLAAAVPAIRVESASTYSAGVPELPSVSFADDQTYKDRQGASLIVCMAA